MACPQSHGILGVVWVPGQALTTAPQSIPTPPPDQPRHAPVRIPLQMSQMSCGHSPASPLRPPLMAITGASLARRDTVPKVLRKGTHRAPGLVEAALTAAGSYTSRREHGVAGHLRC